MTAVPRLVHSSGYNNPVPTTDAIIDGREGIVLVTRKRPPYGLALPGGFAEGGLTLEENVRKEAKEETGLTFVAKGKKHFGIFDDPLRDPRGHMISITYAGRGYGELIAGDDAKSARVYSIEEIRHLINNGSIDGLSLQFDHAAILAAYLEGREQFLGQKPFGRAGVVGRFRPLHNGSAAMLEAMCEQADEVVIGIGSSNKYDFRNPFTAEETIEMLGLHLSKQFSNYSFLCIPDFGHIPQFRDGSKWVGEVAKAFGKLDAFVTGNEYVANLLEGHYAVIAGQDIIPKEKWAMMCGTMVRTAMAQGTDLRHMMPSSVADYLESKKLVERFRREFGLETLAAMAGQDIYRRDADAEHFRIASAVE